MHCDKGNRKRIRNRKLNAYKDPYEAKVNNLFIGFNATFYGNFTLRILIALHSITPTNCNTVNTF